MFLLTLLLVHIIVNAHSFSPHRKHKEREADVINAKVTEDKKQVTTDFKSSESGEDDYCQGMQRIDTYCTNYTFPQSDEEEGNFSSTGICGRSSL